MNESSNSSNSNKDNKNSSSSNTQVVVTNDNIPATPCEPGTKVLMEGIVWHETDSGMLVVNVTWRNKTYIGTLLDSTKYTWSAPRMIDNESGSESKSGARGRKKTYTRPSFVHATTTERKTRRSQMAAQAAIDNEQQKRGKKNSSKKNKNKVKKEAAAAPTPVHDDDEEDNTKKGKKKDDDRATPKSKKPDNDSDNDKKKKSQNRSNTPVVNNKDEDYHPKKRYKQTPKYAEEEEAQPIKKRKNAKNDGKPEKKGKSLRSNTPTERNNSNDNDTGVKSPNFNRHVPPSMPHLSYNGNGKSHKVQVVTSKTVRNPPPLQRAPPIENDDSMDVDIPEVAKPKPKELAKVTENISPGKRSSPAYSDISDTNEDGNSPVLGTIQTQPGQALGPPPKLVSRPKLPNSTAQPQPNKTDRVSPSSTRLPGTPGESAHYFQGKIERNLNNGENKQSETDKKEKVQNPNVMKPPYPQMKQSPLLTPNQHQKPNLHAGQKVADQITREAAQQQKNVQPNLHRIPNPGNPRNNPNFNPKNQHFRGNQNQNFQRPANTGNFVHPNNRHQNYSSSTASAAIAATQRGYSNMGMPLPKR